MTDQRVERWRRLSEISAPFQLTSVKVIESNIFEPQLIEIPRALAVVGRHSSGKTLLLRMIEAVFNCTNGYSCPPFIGAEDAGTELSPIEGIVEVSIRTPNGLITREINLAESCNTRASVWEEGPASSYSTLYGSPVTAFSLLAEMYQHLPYIPQDTNAGRGRTWKLGAPELKAMLNILGRAYKTATVHTVCLDEKIEVPYISAIDHSTSLDSMSMSQGELWVHYVLSWMLNGRAEEGNLILLDEPETFLAPVAHRPFIDEVARKVLAQQRQLIVATHAPEVLARFPLENIRMCVPSGNRVRIIPPTSVVQIRDSIGIETEIRSLILVEDDLAERILSRLFAYFDSTLTRESEIVSVGGESEVRAGLRIISHSRRLRVLGVLDGDQNSASVIDSGLSKNSLLFLLGVKALEEELLSSAGSEALWVSELINRPVDDVLTAISWCQSLDHQYRIRELARLLSQTEDTIIFISTQAWLRNPRIKDLAEELVRDIRAYVSGKDGNPSW